jgi:hypothetical protein
VYLSFIFQGVLFIANVNLRGGYASPQTLEGPKDATKFSPPANAREVLKDAPKFSPPRKRSAAIKQFLPE